jgi:hypothetical protein
MSLVYGGKITRSFRRYDLSRPGLAALFYSLAAIAAILVTWLPGAEDYVGPDNDDAMRLVQVRDFLSGQSWFDLTQYRLGLTEGTAMHWSRLIDLPIAALIRLFGLVLAPIQAEAMAATLWPLFLIPLLLWPLALAAYRIGGAAVMHVALGMGLLFIVTCARFFPGALDHHNVQLVLVMWIAAMLVDPERRPSSFAIAGFTAALAVAVGVETIPLVAIACAGVSLQWMWHGPAVAKPVQAFGLSLTLSISALFVTTVTPSRYAVVTCDNLSLGFYSICALGGFALFLLAWLSTQGSRGLRSAMGALVGGVLLLTAQLLAPQCLGDPLGSLDPMLHQLWLDGVTEARSITAILANEPESIGGFYAVGLFAMCICVVQIARRERPEVHLTFLALIMVAWAVSLIQVRGFFFANLLAILPLSLLVEDLRLRARRNPRSIRAASVFVAAALASVPAAWAVAGEAGARLWSDHRTFEAGGRGQVIAECGNKADMAALNKLPAGLVAAPSDNGARILLNTHHEVLTAPYHRNQKGMLTELHIGLAVPEEARAYLRSAGVSILAFCPTDIQTRLLARIKPDGLYAELSRNVVPPYLMPIDAANGASFAVYRVSNDE